MVWARRARPTSTWRQRDWGRRRPHAWPRCCPARAACMPTAPAPTSSAARNGSSGRCSSSAAPVTWTTPIPRARGEDTEPMSELTVVVPAYNEAAVLDAFHDRLTGVLDALALDSAVLYVDDGSSDGTWAAIERLLARDRRVRALKLSRNFGKEAA